MKALAWLLVSDDRRGRNARPLHALLDAALKAHNGRLFAAEPFRHADAC
ncbi:hypothetical protein [Streptomyces mirabilis]